LDTVYARDPQIERLMLSLKAELEAGGTALGGRLYAESLANALVVHLLREHSSLGWGARQKAAREPEGGLSAHALKQALDYVGDNLAGEPSLAGMAAAAGLSPNHFSKLFKRSTGLPPTSTWSGSEPRRPKRSSPGPTCPWAWWPEPAGSPTRPT
jgi:AraC family transcriptional regulator